MNYSELLQLVKGWSNLVSNRIIIWRLPIFNVAVDLRPGETFGHAYSAVLTFENHKQMYIPRGFAHGYLTLEDDTLMQWCVDNDFCGEAAKAVRYDSDFVWEGESWPEGAYIISEKDKSAKSLQELAQCGLIKA